MKKLEITVGGEAYPCYPTMGALLRFRQEAGKEATEIDGASFTDLCTYLWCCAASASRREGKPFTMSLMDFADRISPEDMAAWSQALAAQGGEEGGDGEGRVKKKP